MRGRARSVTLIAGALIVIGFAALFASVRAGRTESLADRAHEIAAGLRCPVCQNLSVADSPSRLAGEMRSEISTRLRSGQSPERIRAYFVDRYGEWILLEPPRRGLNWVPWAVPVVALVAGVAVWMTMIRRRRPSGEPEPAATDSHPTRAERERIDRELADLQDPG